MAKRKGKPGKDDTKKKKDKLSPEKVFERAFVNIIIVGKNRC
jgi:hypothetical protein